MNDLIDETDELNEETVFDFETMEQEILVWEDDRLTARPTQVMFDLKFD